MNPTPAIPTPYSSLPSKPVDRWDGESYKQKATLQHTLGLMVIKLHKYSSEKRILDVGCGAGVLTRDLAVHFNKCREVIGIDTSDSMIETAKKEKTDKVTILKHDITDAGITSLGLFELIFSFNTLHWVKDQEGALKNIYSLLTFGGTLRAQLFPPLAGQKILIGNIEKLKKIEKWNVYLKDYQLPKQMEILTVEDYASLLRKVGFEVSSAEEASYCFSQTQEEVIDGLKTWLPHLQAIPLKDREEFLKDLVQLIFIEKGKKEGEKADMSLPYWLIHALK